MSEKIIILGMTDHLNDVITLVCAHPYKVDVNFGMTQSSSTSITGHNSVLNVSYWLLCHQLDGKVLVHLYINDKISVIIN